jgi:hypothetical protein
MTLCLAVATLILAPAALAYNTFSIAKLEHLDVTTYYGTGYLWDSSTANVILGGYVISAYVNNEATLNFSGGSVNFLDAYNTSSVNLLPEGTGGGIEHLYAHNSSSVDISGAIIGYLDALDTSSVNISGGRVNYLDAYSTSNVNISGGIVSYLYAEYTSSVNISGGRMRNFQANDTSTTTFYGQDFILGEGLWLDGNQLMGTGILTGEWVDGTIWTTEIMNHDATATILLIPEPASILLLSLGGFLAIRKKRLKFK